MQTDIPGRNSNPDWWRRAVVYEVYIRSFADGNGDGIGDFTGIRNRLGYLRDLGVDAVWISPFFPSSGRDGGYDVEDHCDVDPVFGTLDEFEALVDRIHGLGLRVLIDLVPNHTSISHPWFRKALGDGPGSKDRDRYFIRQSGEGPPNNWGSVFGGPAWSRLSDLTGNAGDRDWWYLHTFARNEADLNWASPAVRADFESILRFWLDRGVDGFRVDGAHTLVKAEGLPDDDIGPDRFSWVPPAGTGPSRRAPDVGPAFDQEGVHGLFRDWRRILDSYGADRMMSAEAWVPDPVRAASYVRFDELSQVFAYPVLAAGWDPVEFARAVEASVRTTVDFGAPTTWVMSNHDVVRHATRLGYPVGARTGNGIGFTDPQPDRAMGLERARAVTAFLVGMPGSIYLYSGEELGLPEVTDLPDEARQDPIWEQSGRRARGRDGCRVPLPWASGRRNHGFGDGDAPWLPQPSSWADYCVDVQQGDPGSVLNEYRRLIDRRRALWIDWARVDRVWADGDLVIAKVQRVHVCINMGTVPHRLPFAGHLAVVSGQSWVSREDNAQCGAGEFDLPPNTAAWVVV